MGWKIWSFLLSHDPFSSRTYGQPFHLQLNHCFCYHQQAPLRSKKARQRSGEYGEFERDEKKNNLNFMYMNNAWHTHIHLLSILLSSLSFSFVLYIMLSDVRKILFGIWTVWMPKFRCLCHTIFSCYVKQMISIIHHENV